MATRHNVFTYYQTNHPNILGGYMTYNSFEQARKDCDGGWGTEIYICTIVRRENNIGINVGGALCKLLWRDLIWKKNGIVN